MNIYPDSRKKELDEFQKAIGYYYKDPGILQHALTHSSYSNENKMGKEQSNERLEFLGDSVLSIVVSEYLYKNHTGLTEGELTKKRAAIVCEASLVKCSNKLNIGDYLLLGKGEELTGGRTRISILSDAFEAIIGSIYLDGGMEMASGFIHMMLDEQMKASGKQASFIDYKTRLQEKIQKDTGKKVHYELLEEKGPDHNKQFVVRVIIGDEPAGTGEGRSKKEAEQNAAALALKSL